tara:strand:- start:1067 stop:1585 length:519 start_codon:yes stop_codon:yes gene_type:complete
MKTKQETQPFIVYYTLSIKVEKDTKFKSIVLAKDKEEAKAILLNKLDRDFILYEVRNIKCFLIRKNNYKGKRLSDKEWDTIISMGYPNGKHKLYKFAQNDSLKQNSSKNRDKEGRFKKGFTPWNKNLKLQIVKKDSNGKFSPARDSKGRILNGSKPVIVGAKPAPIDDKGYD